MKYPRWLRWRLRWPTTSCILLLGVMWFCAAHAAGQIVDGGPVDLKSITVSFTVAVAAGAAAIACAWKVGRELGDLGALVRALREDLAELKLATDQRHIENIRRLERLEDREQ